jgi:hypothetical protein
MLFRFKEKKEAQVLKSLKLLTYFSVLLIRIRIRIRRIRMFLDLLDPDPVVRDPEPEPAPSIIKQKQYEKP